MPPGRGEASSFYAELKGWQGTIGSFLGFIAGALVNFRLNRRRDERLRGEEVVAIAYALCGERELIRRSVARMANAIGARHFQYGFGGREGEPYAEYFATSSRPRRNGMVLRPARTLDKVALRSYPEEG